MPNETEMEKIRKNFNNSILCPQSEGKNWTEWISFTNLSETESDGNDYETLDQHRSKFKKFVRI